MPERGREAAGARGEALLLDLLELFPGDGLAPEGLEFIPSAAVPEPYRTLLVHREHMTVTLEDRHGTKLELVVLARRHDNDAYSRKLVLRAGAPARVVLLGIMKVVFHHTGDAVRARVLEERTPLGRILIEHEVLRYLEPFAYLRVPLNARLRELFGAPASATVTYGRVAGIICPPPAGSSPPRGPGGAGTPPVLEPAVELLEIVSPENP